MPIHNCSLDFTGFGREIGRSMNVT